jgi:hypothetical protein
VIGIDTKKDIGRTPVAKRSNHANMIARISGHDHHVKSNVITRVCAVV